MTRNCDINWYKGQKFLDASIMLNHGSMFWSFYLVIQIVSEATWHWHSLNFPRDLSTKIRHVSLQMESMKLKRVEQAGKQRHSDIIPGESPEKFWPRFCFETFVRYNIAVAIADAWSHKVFTTWSVEVTTWSCPEPSRLCRQIKRYVDIQKLLSRFWSWVMTWPSLLFDYLVFTWLYPAGFFNFEVSQSL